MRILEDHLYAFAVHWNWDESAVMNLPVSRRYRLIKRLSDDIEAQNAEQAAQKRR